MAGRGGLNLTHSEAFDVFLSRYGQAEAFLTPLISAFPPDALRAWCHALGEETFVGSSGRVFPVSMKASPLLRSWLQRLDQNGVQLLRRHAWTGLRQDGTMEISGPEETANPFPARAVLLALGGATWPKLGSDAAWVPLLEAKGISVNRFQPANCGFQVNWSGYLKDRFSGRPLKRIAITHDGRRVAGEAMLSEQGLEGGVVYALSAQIRKQINRAGRAVFEIDLRPAMSVEALEAKLDRPRGKQSMATFLKKALKLKPEEIALLRETGDLPDQALQLAQKIKAVPVMATAPYAIDRAISSAGGIALAELDDRLMLKKQPGLFAADEAIRVGERHKVPIKFVSNSWMRLPEGDLIERVVVPEGPDEADNWIAERARTGDVVITADVPLAARCVKTGALVIGPTGKPFSEDGIGMRLAMRDLKTHLREIGEIREGGPSFTKQDRSRFLNQLETIMRAAKRLADPA
eukprot:g1026.t1